MPEVTIKPEEHVLFIINDNTIRGTTRFQKYGFLLFKQYQKELKKIQSCYPDFEFYDDWKAYYFGPFSDGLKKDLDKCIESKLLIKVKMPNLNNDGKNLQEYALTIKGRKRWRELFDVIPEMEKINDKIKHLQKISYMTLLKQIYTAYPEYTSKSRISDIINDL